MTIAATRWSRVRLERLPSSGRSFADLLAAWDPTDGVLLDRPGAGLATRGVAAIVDASPGPAALRSLAESVAVVLGGLAESAGEPSGPLPLACGAIPFDPRAGSRLVVPQRALLRRRGQWWRLFIEDAGFRSSGAPLPAHPPGSDRSALDVAPADLAASQVVTSDVAVTDFAAAIAAAVARIRAGDLAKVVLARSVSVTTSVTPADLVRRLRIRDPAATVYGLGGLVGATPELLVRRKADRVLSIPHAGTTARLPDPTADVAAARRLLCSTKDLREHALTVEAVVEALRPVCASLQVPRRPRLARTASVWHLATPVRGRLRRPWPTSLELAAFLHPTPAVAGTPRETALATIADLEGTPRGLYAGLIGWQDAAGDGEWSLTLRCALIADGRARLYAGCGIVADSDPDAEVAESEAKLRTLEEALVGA